MRALLLAIVIILTIVPFFWFKPGEINLGGDSSRLYFYDPINYLKNFPLYSVAPSQTGEAMVSYFFIPFTLFLAFFKQIIHSTHLLINMFHSFMLVTSFMSIYLIIIELLKDKAGKRIKNLQFAAIVGGLFYSLTPVIGFNWDKALITHNQVFLNPLIFFLLLRFIHRKNVAYLLITLLITFIFAPNFSFISAPPFFAFYPFILTYLFLYGKFIKKTSFPWRKIIASGFLFIIIHSLHIIPQADVFLDRTSNAFLRVFSLGGVSEGLQYFSSVYPSIKLTNNLAALPQGARSLFLPDLLFFIFPAIVIWGLLLNRRNGDFLRKKNFLLLSVFFIITIFFTTANITPLGLAFYKGLFFLPGFGMFRNFFGQFMYVFYFFYALVIGHALYFAFSSIKGKKKILIGTSIIILLVVNGWPFIKGDMVNLPILQTKDTKVPFKMDPEFEKALQFIRKNPIDGKYLILPLTDFGYQLIAGTQGGVYIGPSMIGYLTGKKDFPGYVGFDSFSEIFLNLVKKKDYKTLQNFFALFNIRYIFYNVDHKIYESFPEFPYSTMKRIFPNHLSINEFINGLSADQIYNSRKFKMYELKGNYLPHFYITSGIAYSNNPETVLFLKTELPEYFYPAVSTIGKFNDIHEKYDLVVEARTKDPATKLFDNSHLHKHQPFASHKPGSIFYPLVLLRESLELSSEENNPDNFVSLSLLFATKRVSELDKWKNELPSSKDTCGKILRVRLKCSTWESSLARYEQEVERLIAWVEKQPIEDWQKANKIKINEQVREHERKLREVIRNSDKSEDEKTFLLSLQEDVFKKVFKKLKLDMIDPSRLTYELEVPTGHLGEYEVYLENTDIAKKNLAQTFIEINGKIIKPRNPIPSGNWVRLDTVDIQSTKLRFSLNFPPKNVLTDSEWQGSGGAEEEILAIYNLLSNNSGGLVKRINDWIPKKQYLISFDYKTFGDDFVFKFYDRKETKDKRSRSTNLFFEKRLNSQDWMIHQSLITSDLDAISAFMQIINENEKTISKIAIKNLLVTERQFPKIVFRRANGTAEKDAMLTRPKITFTKINPTRYKIRVSGAKDPYTLVFLEAYNAKWKLVLPKGQNPTESVRGFLSRIAGEVGEKLVGLLSKEEGDKSFEKTIATYFNEDVNEGMHKNAFLDGDTFETWGQDPIAEDRHMLVNGYANAWHIVPEDVSGKTDYELIVEMTSQKLFYGSMLISFIGLGSAIIWLFIGLKRNGFS